MIKADAYGHGLIPLGKFFAEEMLAQALGVATLGEAEALTLALPDFKGRVYVFSDTLVSEKTYHARYKSHTILPVIADLASLEVFLSDGCFKHLPLTLKLNTGMNRLGVAERDWEQAIALIKASGRRSVQHLMSHFACAAQKAAPGDQNQQQQESFARALALFRGAGLAIEETSLANSGAIEQGLSTEETWVRPGLMLYGPVNFATPTKLVSRLVTQVMRVFPVKRGEHVGYGGAVVPGDGEMALLPIGYGDGFVTQSTGQAWAFGEASGSVFGRVNMDMSFLYFTGEHVGKVKEGMELELWGTDGHARLEAWARHCGTHAYQALCGISSRVPRIYRLE
jgi:alanine racemase